MSMSAEPALVGELQTLIATVNGMKKAHEDYTEMLMKEVSRREMDLVCTYLEQHPQVPLTAEVREEVRKHRGGSVGGGAVGPLGPAGQEGPAGSSGPGLN